MDILHAKSGEVIEIHPLVPIKQTTTTTLVKTKTLEIIRLVILAGKDTAEHQAHGEVTIQCLEGRVSVCTSGKPRELIGGQLLYLASDERPLHGIEDASILLTILLR
jgi:quercetin dioxygenase-like cupin family protein